jgi:hypothetical protein
MTQASVMCNRLLTGEAGIEPVFRYLRAKIVIGNFA